ncbi:Uncharacterised protein [Sphingobacterium daejeonense]|nr:Uncharacterised protein [Sphingobacterium daejeonense]
MKIASNTNAVGVACLLNSYYKSVIAMGLCYYDHKIVSRAKALE